MTLLFQQNLGTAWGINDAAPVVRVRRGARGRGYARNYGRHLWWLVVLTGLWS